MIIFDNSGNKIDLMISDDTYSYEAIMGEDTLTLYFLYPGFLNVPVGSWCDFYGKRYFLKKDSNFKKNGERNFEYTLILETSKADTQLWKVRNTVDNRIKFSFTARPKEHLCLLVDNLNRRSSGWEMGECIDGIEKTINYSHTYILDGLNQVADIYKTEYQITEQTVDGKQIKTVHLCKVEYNKDNPLALSCGKGNGFKVGVGRQSGEMPPEIILAETTERNIDYSKYGAKELLLPKDQTLRFDGVHFENESEFDVTKARSYKTDADGYCVMRADRGITNAKEDSLDCTEIYPSRIGAISDVITVDADKHFYDFIDNGIPESLDFSKYRIDGEKITIAFQTGMLAGKEFDIEQSDGAVSGYVHSERRFKLVPQEIDGITMPDGDLWMPRVNDLYVVFGIQLPDEYICDNSTKTGASWDVFREAVKYLYEHEDKKFTFTGTLDGIWAKKRWLDVGGKIKLGSYINFSDAQFHPEGSLIRIIGIKRYVNKPYSPEIELSNEPVGTSISSELNKIETNEVTVDNKHKEALQFTKRRFRDAQETMNMLAASLLNFSGSINPITVATMQMLVGDESLQFRFVNSKTNPVQVSHNVIYNKNTRILNAPSGILQHMTLGIKTVSSEHKAGEYKFWDMAQYNSPVLIESSKKYYLYAKCSKSNQSGTFRLEETAIGLEQITGYYHFLVGVLNSEYDGDRSYVPLYGFTEILPGQITTDKIVSSDGLNFMDFVNNAFRVGNNSNYFDWNTQKDGKLRLKGTLIQSPSGVENTLGVFRGTYNSYMLYYKGDEVTYNGSMYRCIKDCPTAGIMPINTTYWQLVAQKGTDGINGLNYDLIVSQNPVACDEYGFPKNSTLSIALYKKSGNDTSVLATNTFIQVEINFNSITYNRLLKISNGKTDVPLTSSGFATLKYVTIKASETAFGETDIKELTIYPVKDGDKGNKGDKGDNGPALVYRGNYSNTTTYYGTSIRVDVVKYNGIYYKANINSGGFYGIIPTNTEKWENFGAQFESVATNLLLAENANVANWIFSNGMLKSQNNAAYLNGINGSVSLANGKFKVDALGGVFADLIAKKRATIITPENIADFTEVELIEVDGTMLVSLNVYSIGDGFVIKGNFMTEQGETYFYKDGVKVYLSSSVLPCYPFSSNSYNSLFLGKIITIQNDSNISLPITGYTYDTGNEHNPTSRAIMPGEIYTYKSDEMPVYENSYGEYIIRWLRRKVR